MSCTKIGNESADSALLFAYFCHFLFLPLRYVSICLEVMVMIAETIFSTVERILCSARKYIATMKQVQRSAN